MKSIGLLLLLQLASSAQDTCSAGECTTEVGEKYKGMHCVRKCLEQMTFQSRNHGSVLERASRRRKPHTSNALQMIAAVQQGERSVLFVYDEFIAAKSTTIFHPFAAMALTRISSRRWPTRPSSTKSLTTDYTDRPSAFSKLGKCTRSHKHKTIY